MASKRSEPDGVRIVASGGVRREVWLVALVALAVAVGSLLWLRAPRPEDAAGAGDAAVADAKPWPQAPAPMPARENAEPVRLERLPEPARPLPAGGEKESGALRRTPEGEAARAQVEAAVNTTDGTGEDSGDAPTGIELFPPPGTDPIKPGIVVPDDFPLPPGYVRHYQVTDDGEQLPAILMFHPDYAPVSANGQPLPVPADRIVPPEMAPAGLAIHMLEVPESQVPMIEVPEGEPPQDAAP